VSAIKAFFGQDAKITPEITPCLESQPKAISEAKMVGMALRERLEKREGETAV
jgi:hypothetical protein